MLLWSWVHLFKILFIPSRCYIITHADREQVYTRTHHNMESPETVELFNSSTGFDNGGTILNKTDIHELECIYHRPPIWQIFQEIPTKGIVLLVVCGIVCLMTVIMATCDIVFLYKNIQNSKLRTRLLIIRALYGITSVTSLSGAISPRANTLVDLVSSCYLALCLFNFLHLIIDYHGGQDGLVEAFSGKPVQLQGPPCCCCCCCLPTIELNVHRFNRIKWLVRQVIIVCPSLVFVAAVLWANDLFTTRLQVEAGPVQLIYSMIKLISQLTAIYGLLLIYKNVDPAISQKYKMKGKFILLQMAFILTNLQPVILGILAVTGVIPCSHLLHSSDRAAIFGYAALILEMFILSFFVTKVYRGDVSNSDNVAQASNEGLSGSKQIQEGPTTNGINALPSDKRYEYPYHWGVYSLLVKSVPSEGDQSERDDLLVMDKISVC